MRFANIQARCEGGVVLYGSSESRLRDITIDSLDLRLEKWSKWPGGYLDLRPMDLRGSDVFVDPAADPGRIPRLPAVLAQDQRGLRLHEVRLRESERWPDYISGPPGTEDVEQLSIEGLTVSG